MAINRRLVRDHAALLATLDLIIEQASDPVLCESCVPEVSKWSVKDHLEHLSIANHGIVTWVEKALDGDPSVTTGGRPSLLGRIVLVTGGFPRGRGKAPERTQPTGVSAEELLAKFRRVRERVQGLEDDLAQIQSLDATRNHFVFGDLNVAQWLRFMVIHNNHHQKIIRDVLAAG